MTGEDGYIIVAAGVSDAVERKPASADRRLNEKQQRDLVIHLRLKGWSYRRISSDLAISYSTVCLWLDSGLPGGPAPLSPVKSFGADSPSIESLPSPVRSLPPPMLEELAEQNQALMSKVESLIAANEAQRKAVAEMETRLVASLESQHRKLGERLLEGIKALLAKVLPL